mgnify:CR=1 FL=1
MDGKRERKIKEDERARKKAATEVIKNKEKMKKDGAKKAAQKLAGQSNLSEKQLEASMLNSSGDGVKKGSKLDNRNKLNDGSSGNKNKGSGGGSAGSGGGGGGAAGGGAEGGEAAGGGAGKRSSGMKRGGGDNMGPDPYDMEGDVSVSELRQSERNNNKLDEGGDNSAYEKKQRDKIAKYEKKAEKSDDNKKGIEIGGGEAGKDEVDDLKDDPPHSSEFE